MPGVREAVDLAAPARPVGPRGRVRQREVLAVDAVTELLIIVIGAWVLGMMAVLVGLLILGGVLSLTRRDDK